LPWPSQFASLRIISICRYLEIHIGRGANVLESEAVVRSDLEDGADGSRNEGAPVSRARCEIDEVEGRATARPVGAGALKWSIRGIGALLQGKSRRVCKL
jgi:hypothetical protein